MIDTWLTENPKLFVNLNIYYRLNDQRNVFLWISFELLTACKEDTVL